jgi:hypothetical protein
MPRICATGTYGRSALAVIKLSIIRGVFFLHMHLLLFSVSGSVPVGSNLPKLPQPLYIWREKKFVHLFEEESVLYVSHCFLAIYGIIPVIHANERVNLLKVKAFNL